MNHTRIFDRCLPRSLNARALTSGVFISPDLANCSGPKGPKVPWRKGPQTCALPKHSSGEFADLILDSPPRVTPRGAKEFARTRTGNGGSIETRHLKDAGPSETWGSYDMSTLDLHQKDPPEKPEVENIPFKWEHDLSGSSDQRTRHDL